MNSIERKVYDLVKNNTRLKNTIVWTYQFLLSTLPSRKLVCHYPVSSRENYFFGFHDKVPWSHDDKKLLSHYANIKNRLPKKNEAAKIGYFKGADFSEFVMLDETLAWNWQQGAMLQWVGKTENIVFNDFRKNSVAKLLNTETTKTEAIFENHISCTSPDGQFALCFDFERLGKGMHGYGYSGFDYQNLRNIPNDESGSISLLEINDGKIKPLVHLEDVVKISPNESMKNSFHFFTHCLFSPNSQDYVFFHRWLDKNNKIFTRMIKGSVNDHNLKVFPTNGMVSHICWISDHEIMAYCNSTMFNDAYHIFDTRHLTSRILDQKKFSSDGHPQHNKLRNVIVTDTYPDGKRIQKLIVYDMEHDKEYLIGKFYSPFKYRQAVRVDLHPRWNRKGNMLCFDSSFLGSRSLSTIELQDWDNLLPVK